ncbi:hypothetical protein [Flavobacterium defluvii]|uniref:Uncharacterized protein n=1 Tax=Flavobacterium defluvii TaxID=370979 RepID=A0A1M5N243_9FLAO|nr:hypothetical protein [Flavobacterium defluvii]SHG83515.1 hypothetical protein SAMN05443663_10462 [Flavobacterium defluvii]
MRPLIDENNLSYSKEFLIYYTRREILERITYGMGDLIGSIYLYIQNQLIIFLILFCVFIFQIILLIKSIKRIDEIQFRINSKGIQYRDNVLIPWSNIENERTIREYINSKNDKYYFIYYIIEPGQIMKFDLSELSTDANELSIVLTIQRNRYKRENSII